METFFTTIGCMDGRVQHVVAAFGKEKLGASYPDTITEAGIVGTLAKGDATLLESVKYKAVTVSLQKHHSVGVLVHGHAECAGNPVSDDMQQDDIRRSVVVIKELVPQLPVIGVFVHRDAAHPEVWVADEVPSTITA